VRISIATKVFLGFVAVLVTSGALSIFGIVRMHRIGTSLRLVSAGYFPLTRTAGSMEALQKERTRSSDRLLDESDPRQRHALIDLDRTYFSRAVAERLLRAREQVQSSLKTAEEAEGRELLLGVEARLQGLAERIAAEEAEAAALDALLEKPEAQATASPRELPGLREAAERLGAAQRRVDYEIKALLDVIGRQMSRGVSEAEQQERDTRWALIFLSLLALGVGLLITWLAQRALSPISVLTEAVQALGRGAPDAVAKVEVGERGGDELAVLAREFNAMAGRLAAREKQLRAQSEALLRSERLAAIGRIAAQITHEIRNPLSAIGLNAEELSERLQSQALELGAANPGVPVPEQTKAAVALCAAIGREVDRLAAVTEEYLRYARLPRPQPLKADLGEAVRDLLDFVRPELQAGGVLLESRLDPAVPPLSFDPAQIRQLLLNLVRNAREAMPGGGRLEVVTRTEGGLALIEINDSGPGIPSERLQRIFDPFFTTKERGTGLGLALAQEIAQEHGGQLTCASTVGVGTRFKLKLPL
jgi:signal transduction histidine kinase